MILVILDHHYLRYDAFNKMCAGINENNQEKDERKAPNSNSIYGGSYRGFNSNFRFEIEYRTTVLSWGTYLIDLGCQSASYEMSFMLERHFLHSQNTCVLHCLHRVG